MDKKNTLRSVIIILAFLLAFYGQGLLQRVVDISTDSYGLRLLFYYAWWAIPVVVVVSFLFGVRNIVQELCLDRGFFKGFLFGVIVVSPMFISSAIVGHVDKDVGWLGLMQTTLMAGVMEEVLFRAFLFGILFRRLNWGFIPAALLCALVFGLGHLYQGDNTAERIALFLGTFVGSAWMAWLFIEWKENLWVPIFLHVFMNLSWILFNISENALGDNYSNIFRVITIAFTVAVTIWWSVKRDRFRVNRRNLIFNRV